MSQTTSQNHKVEAINFMKKLFARKLNLHLRLVLKPGN